MRTVFGFGTSAALLSLAIGCGQKDNGIDPNSDPYERNIPASIDGTYKIVGLNYQGTQQPDEELEKERGKNTFEFSGNRLVERHPGGDLVAQLQFDKSKFPPRITINYTADKSTRFGIYKMESNLLTLCLTATGKEEDRPTHFKPDAKSVVFTFLKQ